MYVTAPAADDAGGGGSGPFEVEQRSDRSVQLGAALEELVVPADDAGQRRAVDRDSFWFFLSEDRHGAEVYRGIPGGGFALFPAL